MKRTIVAISLLALITHAVAYPHQQAEQLAGQLAQLLGTKEMFSAYLAQCSAPNSAYDPKYIFKNDPAHFGGISPQSAYWPEIEALFLNYQQRICAYITAEDFEKYFASYYAKTMTIDELKTAIAFYTSPGGKRLSAANQAANAGFQKFAQEKMAELYKKTSAEISSQVVDVIHKYKKAPK